MEQKRWFTTPGGVLKSDSATGRVVAIVNTTNIEDLQLDTVEPGAYNRVIRSGRMPAICWGHSTTDVRGKVLRMWELPAGSPQVPYNQQNPGAAAGALVIDGQLAMSTQAGRDAFELLKGGFITEWSVQFAIAPGGEKADGRGGRKITEISALYECSPVLVGASLETATLSTKGAAHPLGDGENFDEDEYLRETQRELALTKSVAAAERIGYEYAKERFAIAEAATVAKRDIPKFLGRVSKEFAEGEEEVRRLRLGGWVWATDHGRLERFQAVAERVGQKAFRDAYRAVKETA